MLFPFLKLPSFDSDYSVFSKQLSDNLNNYHSNDLFFTTRPAMMRANVLSTKDSYIFEIEAPGLNKKDFNIDVKMLNGNNNFDGKLIITAEYKEENKKNEELILNERNVGKFKRTFHLSNFDKKGIKAKYDNGLLVVTVPKKEKKEEKYTIEIK